MDVKNKNMDNLEKQASKHRKNYFKWWHVPIALILLVVVCISGFYIYVNLHIHQNSKYVNGWNDLKKQTGDSTSPSSTGSDDQSGLDALDAGDFSKVEQKDYPIINVKQKDPNIENILIMGVDGGELGGVGVNRADSMIVATINKKTNTLKLSSLLRDTKTYFPDTDSYHKLNAAFSYGGPGLQIDIINYAYKLDIQKYIMLDFSGFKEIIDTVGGVPITLTSTEASYSEINVGIKAGSYNLDGTHALGYVRTRYIDTDFLRTQRQRNVMFSLFNKFKDVNLMTKASVANDCLGFVKTNVSMTELLGKLLTFESTMNSNIEQVEIPTEDDGMYTIEKSPIWFWNLDWDKEVARLQNFIYGN
jgi:LCP family protein required for cell wall assembly